MNDKELVQYLLNEASHLQLTLTMVISKIGPVTITEEDFNASKGLIAEAKTNEKGEVIVSNGNLKKLTEQAEKDATKEDKKIVRDIITKIS